MTALNAFQRLESPGVWREGPGARLQDVVVSVGDATLILSDPRSERPLSHWSLPAVTRLNPGQRPAIFAPGPPDNDEILEIDDDLSWSLLISLAALARVVPALLALPQPGWLLIAAGCWSLAFLSLALLLWQCRAAHVDSPRAQPDR